MKKIIALLLAFCLLAGLFGCGSKPTPAEQKESPKPGKISVKHEGLELGSRELPLPEGMASVTAQCTFDDKLWLGGVGFEGAVLGHIDEAGKSGLVNFPKDFAFIYSMCQVGEGVAVLCGSLPPAYTNAAGEFIVRDEAEGALALLTFSESGELLSQTPLKQLYQGKGMIFKLMLEAEGFFLFQCQDILLKIGADGTELGRIELQENNLRYNTICLSNDKLLAAARKSNGADTQLLTIDLPSFSITNRLDILNSSVTGLGTGKNGEVLACDLSGLFKLNIEDGGREEIVTWEQLYLSQEFIALEEIPEGYLFYARYTDSVFYAKYQEKAPKRQELILAGDSQTGQTQSLAEAFNRAQDRYYVRVQSYGGGDAPMDLLRTEISAGKGPDIFAFNLSESLSEIKPSNLCENLFPYMDRDKECTRDSILPGLLSCMTEKGALYFLPYAFSIATFTAPESLVGAPGITLKEAEAALKTSAADMTLLPKWVTKDLMLLWTARFSLDRYIDSENGSCNFNSPGFVELLELCGKRTNSGEGAAIDDKALLNLELVQGLLRVSGINANFGGDYCFAGFPTETGNGSMFQLELKLGISQQSKNKEGAWEFLRFALGEKGQEANVGTGFFASQASFTKALDAALKDGISVNDTKRQFSQEDARKLWTLVNDTTLLSGDNLTVLSIITEEANAYFAGVRSAKDAAELIQNRVAIYLAEQG
ncbi:MAG: extracellular solute-binding protein [Oscillospiraceae bacterium]